MTAPRRALVLVDIQQEYFSGALEVQFPPHADSLPQILRAIDAANAAGAPVLAVQHTRGEGAPVFDPSSPAFALHPEVAARRRETWKGIVKQHGSIYAGTDVAAWLQEQEVDTVTLVGYMTNNCILASAVEAERLGVNTEVLSDATGAIHLANEVGSADAQTVHTTLMALLNSNLATVATTREWLGALAAQRPLPGSDLVSSATAGARAFPGA